MDTCVHNFLLWETVLRAKPVQIYAQGGVLAHARPEVAHFERLAVDTAALVVTYGSGDIAAMNVSWGMPAQTRLQPRTDRLLGPLACVDADTALDFMPAQTGAHTAFRLYRGDADEVVQLGRRTRLFCKLRRSSTILMGDERNRRQGCALAAICCTCLSQHSSRSAPGRP